MIQKSPGNMIAEITTGGVVIVYLSFAVSVV